MVISYINTIDDKNHFHTKFDTDSSRSPLASSMTQQISSVEGPQEDIALDITDGFDVDSCGRGVDFLIGYPEGLA